MSKASNTFKQSIMDAENLLQNFDELNKKPPPAHIEVLKRAGLIMAMTAWETYVEDRLVEACGARMQGVKDSSISTFVKAKLADEIKRLNNPAYGKTIELFRDYAGVDLKKKWHWNNHETKIVREKLDGYVKLRGDVVHRSRAATAGASDGQPVKRDELEKAITFLKALVAATEGAFNKPGVQ